MCDQRRDGKSHGPLLTPDLPFFVKRAGARIDVSFQKRTVRITPNQARMLALIFLALALDIETSN